MLCGKRCAHFWPTKPPKVLLIRTVRGMATRPDARRRGLGGMVLEALLDHVAAHGGGLVWCNARVAAQRLYQRAGFVVRGPQFDLPDIGPHHHMWRTVDGDADRTASS